MKQKPGAIIIALVFSLLFLFGIWKGGVFNMIGYTIYLFIYPHSSEARIQNESLFIHSFDVLCTIGIFFIVYKAVSIITKKRE